eukprot:gb/GFBE01074045.1/.p1 GENE.gb/GFBE01074045.1/~~gb/GFBE01074045.1/.p1  ORF type:complete len:509 (+),score=88.60 gb/GFBE01074045.1/:1-1527(+)
MPRRRRTGTGTPGVVPGVPPGPQPAPPGVTAALASSPMGEDRSERTQVFEKTKMCKFHILGACAKGSLCRFAHYPSELQILPDLACTKLCKTLIATGACDNPECRYAHSREELRPLPFPDPLVAKDEKKPLATGEVRSTAGTRPGGSSIAAKQEAFKSAMQSALMQIGHAAQAHAVEAARLQAAAAQLQAATGDEDEASYLGSYGYSYSEGYERTSGELDAAAPSFIPSETKLAVKNTFLHFNEPGSPAAPMRTVASAAGRLCSLGGPDSSEALPELSKAEVSFGSAMSRALAEEPVQINLQSLRSMSSNSLVTLGEDNAEDWKASSPVDHPPGLPSTKKSSRHPTLSDMPSLLEDEGEKMVSSLLDAGKKDQPMPIPSKASPLLKPNAGSLGGYDEEGTPLDALAEFLCGQRDEFGNHLMDGLALEPGHGSLGADINWMSMNAAYVGNTSSAFEGDQYSALMGSWNSGHDGLAVKNTFLDFGHSFHHASGLRHVQTAAGRLDLLGQE